MKQHLFLKLLSFLVTMALMLGGAPAFAQDIGPALLEGYVLGAEEGTILLDTQEYGEIRVHVDDASVFEGIDVLPETNAYVYVTYDGNVSASLPGQVYGQKITAYVIAGEIKEVAEKSLMIVQDDTADEVIVHLPDNVEPMVPGARIRVYTDGTMALSLPPQVVARSVCGSDMAG